MTQSNSNELWFGPLFRIAGYALLVLSLFDIIEIFVPPRFEDPVWEFQIARSLVERAPVPLLGLVLVLAGEKSKRIFKFLSWASLVVGVLFILLVPLGVSASVRIDQQNQQQLTSQLNQQTTQIQQLRNVVSKATTAEELGSILARLNPQRGVPQINDPQQLKTQLLSQATQAEKKIKDQTATNRGNARQELLKRAIKSLLGALVCGAVFLTIWNYTHKVLKVSKPKGKAGPM